MLYNKSHLSVRHASSKDETRYNLNGVHFLADGSTEATNGHLLIRARVEPQPVEEFPSVESVKPSDAKLEPFILPSSAVDALVKRLPKRAPTTMPILANALLDVEHTNTNGAARFITTDLEVQEVTEDRKIDGDFPDTDKVFPEGEPIATFGINLDYLALVLKAVKEFTSAKHHHVKVEVFEDPHKPIKITHTDGTGELVALVMPVRL